MASNIQRLEALERGLKDLRRDMCGLEKPPEPSPDAMQRAEKLVPFWVIGAFDTKEGFKRNVAREIDSAVKAAVKAEADLWRMDAKARGSESFLGINYEAQNKLDNLVRAVEAYDESECPPQTYETWEEVLRTLNEARG